MRYIIFFLFLMMYPLVHAEETFDASCFREHTTLNTTSGVTAIGVKNVDDDIFFVFSGKILPSRVDTTEKNPPITYTSTNTNELVSLQDSDPFTAIEIDPYAISRGDISYTFDLGKVYPRDTLLPTIGYYTHGKVEVQISTDGSKYTPVSLYNIASFDFRYLKITFLKQTTVTDITRFHTLTFFSKIQTRYLVETPDGTIDLYASYTCQQGKYKDFLSMRTPLGPINTIPSITKSVTFGENPAYRNDSDNDGVENLTDNCPIISNSDQSDRNRDGIGDVCSDDDNDGIAGTRDNCPTVSNRDQADKNANSIGDACEFDADNDGVPDGTDNAIHITNPDQKDSDMDRIGDVIDNCNLYNPDQLDLNKNGKGDVCDAHEEYQKTHDSDNDGILDAADNCEKVSNTDQKDTDHDGIGDVCDNCIGIQNYNQEDSNKNAVGDVCEDMDNDMIDGWRDNCPTIANPDQSDANNNQIGNACEDTDHDAVYDSTDNCPAHYNKDQRDTDNDLIGNACDTEDNRVLESNKTLFIVIFSLVSLLFIGVIFYFVRKLNL